MQNVVQTSDMRPVVHGYWISYAEKYHDANYNIWECSVCHENSCCEANYCPDCGAKMDGEQREAAKWK